MPMTRGTAASRFASIAASTRSSRSPGVISSVRSRRSSTAWVACIAPIATPPIVWRRRAREQLPFEVGGDQLERRVGEELRIRDAGQELDPMLAQAALDELRQV